MSPIQTATEARNWHIKRSATYNVDMPIIALKPPRYNSYDSFATLVYEVVSGMEFLADPDAQLYDDVEAATAALENAYPAPPYCTRVLSKIPNYYHYGNKRLYVLKQPVCTTADPLVAKDLVARHGTLAFLHKLKVEDSSSLYLLMNKASGGFYQYGASKSWSSRRQAAAKAKARREHLQGIYPVSLLDIIKHLGINHRKWPTFTFYHECPYSNHNASRTYKTRTELSQKNTYCFIGKILEITPQQWNLLCRKFPEKVYNFLAGLHDISYYLSYHESKSDRCARAEYRKFKLKIASVRRRVGYPHNPLKELPSDE